MDWCWPESRVSYESVPSLSFGGIVELLGRALLTRKTCGKLPATDTICSFRTSIGAQVLLKPNEPIRPSRARQVC